MLPPYIICYILFQDRCILGHNAENIIKICYEFCFSAADVLDDSSSSINVSAVVTFSKGFACSGESGTVWLFEKTGEKDLYARTRLIKVSYCDH